MYSFSICQRLSINAFREDGADTGYYLVLNNGDTFTGKVALKEAAYLVALKKLVGYCPDHMNKGDPKAVKNPLKRSVQNKAVKL